MKTKFSNVILNLDENQEKILLEEYKKINSLLESEEVMDSLDIEKLSEAMVIVLNQLPAWQTIKESNYDEHKVIKIIHNDNQILNLPWQFALEKLSNAYLQKGLNALDINYTPKNPLPLKILIMVSSPEDTGIRGRLSYEDEELNILRAFDNLLETGQVQIDFTDDGSLDNLKDKLNDNHYHILHFSGHGSFDGNEGRLLVEKELSLKGKYITAKEFADILNNKPENIPSLILLSSCQSAQGNSNNFSGIVNELIQLGIPAVIAMGWSIKDYYATKFASIFYNRLSQQEPLHRAFQYSINQIREIEERVNRDSSNLSIAKQWLIPQLYTSGNCEHIIDWNSPIIRLKYKTQQFRFKEHHNNYYFVGRRREKKEIISSFFSKTPIWLKGQGGVGKSSMAEHLIQRLFVHQQNVVVFELNETNFSLTYLENELITYLEINQQKFTIRNDVEQLSKEILVRIKYLLSILLEVCSAVFLFDNLEEIQEREDNPNFKAEYHEFEELIIFLHKTQSFYIIYTGRYLPPPFIEKIIFVKDLNQVGFSDFWKKTQQLQISTISNKLSSNSFEFADGRKVTYEELIYLLYKVLGGNFRALEFFDNLFRINSKSSQELVLQFQRLIELPETINTLERLSEDLVFSQLLKLLNDNDIQTLSLLYNFRKPILETGLEMQSSELRFDNSLQVLSNLTLIEKRGTLDLPKYYVTPLVRNLLLLSNFSHRKFDHNKAAEYYEYYFKSIDKFDISSKEEAFEHYCWGYNKEKINDLGSALGAVFTEWSYWSKGNYFISKAFDILKDNADGKLWNLMGLLSDISGDIVGAEYYYDKSIIIAEKEEDFLGQIFYLSNKGTFFLKQAKYVDALEQLNKSIYVCEKSGHNELRANVLNSIGSIYSEQGKNEEALKYFNEGLVIAQDTKQELVEANISNSMAGIYSTKGQHKKALDILYKNLEFYENVGFLNGQKNCLSSITSIYHNMGEFENSLEISKKNLKLCIKTKDKRSIGLALNNHGYSLLKSQFYEEALKYLEDALKIQTDVNDLRQICFTTNNIGLYYFETKNYRLAEDYFLKAEKLSREINNTTALLPILSNLAELAGPVKNDMNEYLKYRRESYKLSIEIGNSEGILKNGKSLGITLCRIKQSKEGLDILKKIYLYGINLGYPKDLEIEKEIQNCILSKL